MLVRTVECIDGQVDVELVCEPAFDYGRAPAEWALVGDDRHAADATGAGQTIRLRSDLALGIEGNRVRGRHTLAAGERAYCALSWAEELAGPGERGRGGGEDGHDDALLAGLARPRAHPGSPLPRPDPALRPGDQGPDLHAHRRHGRGADHIAPGDAGRRAQLGLPLHLDARHDLHAAGPPLPQPRLGGRRVHAVRRRPRAHRGRLAPDHVRDRRPSRPDRDDP